MIGSRLIKGAALAADAGACGISHMSRFDGAPDEIDPQFLFPEAKSCIGFVFKKQVFHLAACLKIRLKLCTVKFISEKLSG